MANPKIIRTTTPKKETGRVIQGAKTNEAGQIIGGMGIVNKNYTNGNQLGSVYVETPSKLINQNTVKTGGQQEPKVGTVTMVNGKPYTPNIKTPDMKFALKTPLKTSDKSVAINSTDSNGGVINNLVGGEGQDLPIQKVGPETPALSNDSLPAPTVATAQNPVIKKTKPNTEPTVPASTEIPSMDENQIYDIIDTLNFKVSQGKPLTVDEYKSLNTAQRQLQNMAKPQPLTGGLDDLISQQQQKVTETKQESAKQNEADLQTFSEAQTAMKETQLNELNDAQDLERKRMSFILGANGGGQGTGTISAYQNMERNFTGKKMALEEAVQAKIDLYGSQLRKDSAETIAKFEQNVLNLQTKAAEFDVENIKELNAYNSENSKSAMEKLDNLKSMSDGILASQAPLTEQEQVQADAWAVSLVKPDGTVNNELLGILQKTNPKIAMNALSKSVSLQQTRVTDELEAKKLANAMDLKYKQAQINDLSKPDKVTYTTEQLDDGTFVKKGSDGSFVKLDENGTPVSVDISAPETLQSLIEFCTTKRGSDAVQCGALVNDYMLKSTGVDPSGSARMGNDYPSKLSAINKLGATSQPVAGGLFAYDIGATGHTGIVTSVNADGSINVLEANIEGSEAGGPPKMTTYTPDKYKNWAFSQAPQTKVTTPKLTEDKKTMYEDAVTAIDNLQTLTEGKKQAVGGSWNKNLTPRFLKGEDSELRRGTKGADFESKFKSLQSMLTLPNLDKLKGAMSDKDIAFLKSASNSLSLNMSEEEFDKTLTEVKNKFLTQLGRSTNTQTTSNINSDRQ